MFDGGAVFAADMNRSHAADVDDVLRDESQLLKD
jgi:hypothetical protein